MSWYFKDGDDEIIKSRLDGFRYYTLMKRGGGFSVLTGYRIYRIGIKTKELSFADFQNALDFFDVTSNRGKSARSSDFTDFRIISATKRPDLDL